MQFHINHANILTTQHTGVVTIINMANMCSQSATNLNSLIAEIPTHPPAHPLTRCDRLEVDLAWEAILAASKQPVKGVARYGEKEWRGGVQQLALPPTVLWRNVVLAHMGV